MAKIARLIIYEGSDEWLLKQLGGSLPDGRKELPGQNNITILTIGCTEAMEILIGTDTEARELW